MKLTWEDIQRIAKEVEEREIAWLKYYLCVKSPSEHYQEYLDSCAFGDWDDDGFPGDR